MKFDTHLYLSRIEEAIIEYKRMSCPEIDCEDMLISKEIVRSDSLHIIEYWCRNEDCAFHAKRKIHINPKAAEVNKTRPSFDNSLVKLLPGMLIGGLKNIFKKI